jgi:hypothetical protein
MISTNDEPGITKVSHDQGSPGRSLTRDHPDDPAEVPSVEVPSVEPLPSAGEGQEVLTGITLLESEVVEAEVVTNATMARDITKAFWDVLLAEGRPTPVLGGNRNSFMALVKIVEQFVESGYQPQLIYDALHDTSVYTMNGITFSLNKQKRESAHRGSEGSGLAGLAELRRLQEEVR